MRQHILLIEDQPDVARTVGDLLTRAGYQVRLEADGPAGLNAAQQRPVDLVLLESELPGMDGAAILARLRENSGVPVIVHSRNVSLERKVELLHRGADDYLTKPAHPDELLARVQVQLRREQRSDVIGLGPLQLLTGEQVCSYGGQPLHLSEKEFSVLAFLAQHPGRVFSREEIVRGVWPGNEPTSNTVNVHLANVRSKLRDLGGYGLIRTVRGTGYTLRRPLRST